MHMQRVICNHRLKFEWSLWHSNYIVRVFVQSPQSAGSWNHELSNDTSLVDIVR